LKVQEKSIDLQPTCSAVPSNLPVTIWIEAW